MKGNEARVVFFLHPVDQLKDGQVSRVQPLSSSFVSSFLLLVGLLLALGVLVYVLLQFENQTISQQELVTTTIESPAIGRVTEVTSNQTRRNDSSTKTELPTEIIPPGIMYDSILCHQSK